MKQRGSVIVVRALQATEADYKHSTNLNATNWTALKMLLISGYPLHVYRLGRGAGWESGEEVGEEEVGEGKRCSSEATDEKERQVAEGRVEGGAPQQNAISMC
jgi:hypothetical protein